MNLYINKENQEKLRAYAKYEGNTMSGLINKLLEDTWAALKDGAGFEYRSGNLEEAVKLQRVYEAKPAVIDKSKPDINLMFEQWATITGVPINGQQQANRRACSNLLKKYGTEKLTQLIQGVAKAQSQEFAPQIANFTQLQAKQDSLILWGRKQAQEENNSEVVKI